MENNIHKQWYVLYTSPRAEKKVQERLVAQEVECWLPLHRSPRVWSDRVKLVDVPLYNSYIFVYCHESELSRFLRIYGVARIVYYAGKPAVVRQKEIDAIKEFLAEASGRTLIVGDEVEILRGGLKNVSGKIKKIKRNQIFLYLEQLGVTVSVKTDDIAPTNRIK
ncbi:UpxY family transcription antiterminator [Parabacteroides sp. OttesenSCG-928-G07]|nr:UpxY family transcription antiterminator [Parabacteroides sp. OttesenSCG-928-G07]